MLVPVNRDTTAASECALSAMPVPRLQDSFQSTGVYGNCWTLAMTTPDQLPLTCAHWGTYRVEAANGRVTALHDFEEDSDPSPIGHGIVDVLDGPNRIKTPMVRKSWLERGPLATGSERGTEPFIQVSWDIAEKLVADELNRVRSLHGNSSIYGGSYGWASAGRFHHAQSQLRRFLNCVGGFTKSVNSYSLAAAEVLLPHIIGNFHMLLDESTSWPSIAQNTKLFVAFGGVPPKNGQINAGGLGAHCQREGIESSFRSGIRFVNVSPLRTDLPESVDAEWLAPRPGTDTAILLGLAHTIQERGLHDQAFIDRYTTGFDRFSHYLNGELDGVAKSANWAAEISEVPASKIQDLATEMAANRTMISVSWSLTRQDHGEQPFWAAVTLAAMLGQIGLPGGGIGFGYGAVNTIGGHYSVIPAASFPQGTNPVKDFIPVARISDMLLNPGATFEYNGGSHAYPDIRLVYWAGGNPFHHHQDLNRLKKAWQKPEAIIVHEWCWNALAKHADIVLPCTTSLERNDIAIARDPYVIFMQKAADPLGECRNDFDIFSGIAKRMGVGEAFTDGLDESGWIDRMYRETCKRMQTRGIDLPDLEHLKRKGWFRVAAPGQPKVMLQAFREDPKRNRLRTPSGKIEIYSKAIAGFGYEDCPGHAIWLEPVEWLGSNGTRRYPLHLISNQPQSKLHSQLDHGSHSRSAKLYGREPVLLNPRDAKARGISAGNLVKLFNERGACLGTAVINESARPGVVQMSTGAWWDPMDSTKLCKHGNPNALTLDKGTSQLAQGPVAHSCLVEVEIYKSREIRVTAHDPPAVLSDFASPST